MNDVQMMMWGGDRAWWVIESVFLRSPDKGFWACLGDIPPDMPRRPETWVSLYNLMMKLCGISRSSAILGSDSPQSNNRKDHSLWVTPFIPRERPNVKHAIAGYLGLPRPTSALALMRVLHWLRCWAEEPGYATGNPPEDYSHRRRLQLPLDDCCRLVLPYNAVTASNRRNRSLMTLPGWGRKVLLLAIIPVPRILHQDFWMMQMDLCIDLELSMGNYLGIFIAELWPQWTVILLLQFRPCHPGRHDH